MERFKDWLREKGVPFDGVEIKSSQESGNGVFAVRDFRLNDAVIEVPEDLLLTASRVADLPHYSAILETVQPRLTPFEVLTLFFCEETLSSSEWSPYLSVLPSAFSTPAFEGRLFHPDHLPLSIRHFWTTQQQELATQFDRLYSLVGVSRDRFLWAWHVVNTRCIFVENKSHPLVDSSDGGDTLAVIPFVDMLNHHPAAQCVAVYERKERMYRVRAHKGISEGDEVFVCYGPHDNPRLFMEYGFQLQNNPFGKVVVDIDLFVALYEKSIGSVSEVHRKAVEEANLPCSLYTSDEGASWAQRTTLRILQLDNKDIQHWKEVVYADREKRWTRRKEGDGDSEEDDEEEREKTENQLLAKMFHALKEGIVKKRSMAADEVWWMWDEQLKVVDDAIDAITPK